MDARQRPVRHVVAVPEEDDVRLPVPRRLHEARVHHPRADVPHEAERREEARDVAFGERVDLPAVPQRPRDEAQIDARTPVPPVADEEVPDEEEARRPHDGTSRACPRAAAFASRSSNCSRSASFGVLRK